MTEPAPSKTRSLTRSALWRGLCKRCPHCGKGPLYKGWLTLHERCPVCGLNYLTNQGDLWAALLLVDRVLFIIPLILGLYFGLLEPNWKVVVFFGGGILLLMIVTLPNRNGVSLAVDYIVRRKNGELPETESSPR